jgi:hypothetical protein
MARLAFGLRGAPEDEAEEVRALLDRNGIPFHETGAGLLGISVPGLWVRDTGDFERARALIDAYQQARTAEQRAAYEQARGKGSHRRLRDIAREDPWRLILYALVAVAILYLSVMPFWRLAQ